jgi:hypothetical protein
MNNSVTLELQHVYGGHRSLLHVEDNAELTGKQFSE